MKKIISIIACILLLSTPIMAQTSSSFVVKGSVKEKDTRKPIRDVEVRVQGGTSIKTDLAGDFRIRVKIGDELMITHDSFESVFYTIKDNQRIDVLVKEDANRRGAEPYTSSKSLGKAIYNKKLKSAKKLLKKDAAASIENITEALETIRDDDPEAENKKSVLFETLGDINTYWKQHDLAESNYAISLRNRYRSEVKIKLGNAQLLSKKYDIASQTFFSLQKSRLNSDQSIAVYEGLGDSYAGKSMNVEAARNYQKALDISQAEKKDAKLITLSSKLAEVTLNQGKNAKAETYFDNSLRLANKKDKKTSARQKTKVADFYNKSNSYDKEIELRKAALEDIEEIPTETDSVSLPEPAITSQVQNYKIANAFVAQDDYEEAIPYLKESIKEAETKNDLVVQKDATRKLGEVYREKGELEKASEAFKEYEVIIDKLYIQKEQKISQANRFSRELATKQNRITTLEKDRELNESRYELALASQALTDQQSLRQRIIIYALIGLSLLLLLAGYLMYRNIKQQRYANNLLALKSLRSQMNPHFIFNALNSVNTFIATSDERTANRYLTDFSMLMRSVLENSEEDFIPLEKEVELLELYVQLEHFRFQDKFEYKIIVDPDIDVSEYMIPPMLLQPYVENAVWHGLRYRPEKGLLTIAFKKIDNYTIKILIEDNGIGRQKSMELKTLNQKRQQSKGMSNIKKRITILNEMYKDKVDVFICDLTDTEEGTRVQLTLKKDT